MSLFALPSIRAAGVDIAPAKMSILDRLRLASTSAVAAFIEGRDRAVSSFTIGFAMVFASTSIASAAGQGIGVIFGNDVTTQGQPLLKGLVDAAFIGGVGFAIYGIIHLIKAHKNGGRGEEKSSIAYVMILAGAAMASISWVVGAGQGTIFSGGSAGVTAPTQMTVQ